MCIACLGDAIVIFTLIVGVKGRADRRLLRHNFVHEILIAILNAAWTWIATVYFESRHVHEIMLQCFNLTEGDWGRGILFCVRFIS